MFNFINSVMKNLCHIINIIKNNREEKVRR